MSASVVGFSVPDAKRIQAVVKRVERTSRNGNIGRRRNVVRGASGPLLCKTDAAIAKGTSGTVSVYSGPPGSETDTGRNVTAFNRFANVGSGKWVLVVTIAGRRYLSAAECG